MNSTVRNICYYSPFIDKKKERGTEINVNVSEIIDLLSSRAGIHTKESDSGDHTLGCYTSHQKNLFIVVVGSILKLSVT